MNFSETNYLSEKLRLADDKYFNIQATIYEMMNLPYDRGTRKYDYILRNKIRNLLDEINNYYRVNKSFEFCKTRAISSFPEVLGFFEERFLNNFPLGHCLSSVMLTLSQIISWDLNYGGDGAFRNVRKINLFALEFEKKIELWESKLNLYLVPGLFEYLELINSIYLYLKMENHVARLVPSHPAGDSRSRRRLDDLTDDLRYFLRIKIKLARRYFPESELYEILNNSLADMGVKQLLLRSRSINAETLNDLLRQVVQGTDIREPFFRRPSGGVSNAAVSRQTPDADPASLLNDMKNVFLFLNDMEKLPLPGNWDSLYPIHAIAGTAAQNDVSILFDTSDAAEVTIKKTAEMLRSAALFVIEWTIKALRKNPELSRPLRPLIGSIIHVASFTSIYKISALSASETGYKQLGFGGLKKGRCIPRKTAQALLDSIRGTCKSFEDAFTESSMLLMEPADKRFNSFLNMMNILRESFAASEVKIMQGISRCINK